MFTERSLVQSLKNRGPRMRGPTLKSN